MSAQNPLDRHGSLYGLAQAASDNDAVAEERGLEAAVTDLGLSLEDVAYVAEQRALRAVLVESDRINELVALRGKLDAVTLSDEERDRLRKLTSVYIDGIALGVRYAQRRSASYGIGHDTLRP